MSRLQTGDANGQMVDGVIPTRYRRVPCPVKGNIYILLKNGGEYYFSFSVVNVSGLGSLVNVEARLPSGDWVSMKRDPNYTQARPQERFGTWVLPQQGPGHSHCPWPCDSRIPQGVPWCRSKPSRAGIHQPPPTQPWQTFYQDFYYIDTGVQF